MNPYQDS